MTTATPDQVIDTRFGPLNAEPGNAVTFITPMPGFESCRRFVLASAPGIEPFAALGGLEGDRPAFLAIDPRLVMPDYDVPQDAALRRQLGVDAGDPLLWLALVAFRGDEAFVNLRAPIVIAPTSMRGVQCIPHESVYPTDYRLPLD
ncbi:MAG: flagellar assembly protein FliW [Acidobacteria bacterium]|nr:flagellar assembly protein FliW [Acidobacteriota bacterium]